MEFPDHIKVEEVANQIVEAAKTTLQPKISHEQHIFAHEFLEKTKDDSNFAIPCGFFLSQSDRDPQVRHLGLQFLEDTIRYHWNDISKDKKMFIKENSMLLLSQGTLDVLVEPIYIKDKVSRLIVEMMKREWPQQWPDLLEELEGMANRGPTQAELVLLIFMRIAEDMSLQNIDSAQRRRDLFKTLNQNMDSIFCFFFTLLERHYTQYRENPSEEAKMKHCRITLVVFSTLTCYVDWVSLHCIQNHENKLFNSMCQLITDPHIRQNAVECLLQIVSRKGRPEERKFMLSLFCDDVMNAVSNAANLAVVDPLNEKNYLFLKSLAQVVTTLGSQLCGLWGKEHGVGEPPCFSTYLNTLLAFSKHPSLTIYSYTTSLWIQLFKNPGIAKNPTLISVVPLWLPVAYSKMTKHGFPSKGDSPSCQYSSLDFDSDEEYHTFFCKARSDTGEAFKLATLICPELLFSFAEEQVLACFLLKDSTPESLLQLQYSIDAVSHVIEKIMSQVVLEKKGFVVPRERVKVLLRQCLDYETSRPDILSLLLTCISGLCALLPLIPEVLEAVLGKLFGVLGYTGGLPREGRPKAVKNTRKHAASLLLKLCRTFPAIFLPAFPSVKRQVALLMGEGQLSQLERVTLLQSLLILNGHVPSLDAQRGYIQELMAPVKEDWLGLRDALSSPASLAAFVGLLSPEDDSSFGLNRSKMFGCIDHIVAVLHRCRPPPSPPGAPNPASPLVLTLLPNVFCFLRAYNGLYLPESLAQLPAHYAKVHLLPEDEKITLLGLRSSMALPAEAAEVPKTPFQRLQVFLRNVHEQLCMVLCHAGPSLGLQFYEYPHLAECLVHSVLWNLQLLPNLKIRFVMRFLKPFVETCPTQCHEPILLPVVHYLAPVMLTTLSSRWECVSGNPLEEDPDEEDVDTDQLVDAMMLHTLTRMYLEVIVSVLTEKVSPKKEGGGGGGLPSEMNGDAEEDMEADIDGEGEGRPQGATPQETLSPLGRMALRVDAICQAFVLTLLRALSWPDTVSCRRAVSPLLLCVHSMLEEGQQHLNGEAVQQLFLGVLSGIRLHGQHKAELDALIDLAVALYEMLVPHFPVIKEVLVGFSEVKSCDVAEFDELLRKAETTSSASASVKKVSRHNKMKKEAFRKVLRNLIGKSVGEALKKEVQLAELKPLFRLKRNKTPRLDEAQQDLNLCSLFDATVAE